MNQIQLQAGMSLNQFLAKYGVEQQCETALEDARWPQDVYRHGILTLHRRPILTQPNCNFHVKSNH